MSIINIQVGQCGNQIGEKLFETIISDCFESSQSWSKKALDTQSLLKTLNQDYIDECKKRFFIETSEGKSESNSLIARSLLIDMESKVVNKLLRRPMTSVPWKYRDSNSYTQKKGSGNNWSFGYCVNGPKSGTKIMELVRKEVERCDRLDGFLIGLSLAGGTGSGVGTYLTERIRNEYPRSCIINPVIWPFSSGEVTIQNYNFILTLSKLYEHSDGLIIFENDQLHEICNRLIDSKKVTFDDLNAIIGHKLASILQPAYKSSSQLNYLSEISTDLCSHPDYKLLNVINVPQQSFNSLEFGSYQWSGLFKQAKSIVQSGWFMEEGIRATQVKNRILGCSLFARGLNQDVNLNNEFLNGLGSSLSQMNPLPIQFWSQRREFNYYSKSLTLLANSQMPVYKIDALVNKAWNMFTQKAFIHQYTKHGFEEELFLNSFLFVEQLIKNYMCV
jgi:tubulin delta